MRWNSWLTAGGAPRDLRDWAASRPDAESSWTTCPRGDWLMWSLAASGAHRRTLVGAGCEIARTTLPLVPPRAVRVRQLLVRAEAWARSEVVPPATGEEGDAPMPVDVRAAIYAAFTVATPDRGRSADSAAAVCRHTAAALATDPQVERAVLQDHADRLREIRWPPARARVRRWPEEVQVAWDVIVHHTRERDLSTVELLCSRSLLRELGFDALRFAPLAERLWRAPELVPEVAALLEGSREA